jgi:diacylglycerol kinase (ATP)
VKPYIIVNPIAGSIVDLNLRLKQLGPLNAREVRVTQRAGDAETLAREAVRAGCDYVIAAGGDGTLNEVINGIATPSPPRGVCVGIVPLGIANDFARSIGMTGDVDTDLYNVVVANGQFVAGGLPIAPQADPSDGVLDAVLIPKRSAAEMALLAAEMLLGKHLSSDAVIFRRAKKISVQSQPGMWFNADGELVGNEPIVFQVLPGALDFVVNKR